MAKKHLIIRQSTGTTEQVSAAVIHKLYQLAFEDAQNGIDSQIDATSDVQGSLQAPAAYEDDVRYLVGIDPGDPKRFQNLYINVLNNNYYVSFEDEEAARVVSAQWGDGVGVTTAQLAQVSNINDLFKNNTVIKKFNELRYFTRITSLGSTQFANASNLEEVDLRNITSIGYTFGSCPNLKKVNNAGNITTFNDAVFRGCSQLKEVDCSGATAIYYGVFGSCTSLENVVSLRNVVTIGNSTFQNCSSLVMDIDMPNLASIGSGTFHGCSGLTSIKDLGSITTLNGSYDSGQFSNCSGLDNITLPATLTTINGAVFKGCTNLRWVKIMATSVPTYTHANKWGAFGDDITNGVVAGQTYPIFVPDSIYASYQSATSWSDIWSRIHPMSDFATMFPDD